MIATDLDGTLLGPDHEVSDRTRAAVAAAAEAGIAVVAATGRSQRTALDKLAGCPDIRWSVCSNGAVLWDHGAGAVARHRAIDGTDAVALVAGLRHHGEALGFAWETAEGFGYDEAFRRHRERNGIVVVPGDVAPPSHTTPVTKVLVSHETLLGNDLHRHLADDLHPRVTVSSSGGPFIEATGLGVDKASTLADLAASWGIAPADVMAFGDQHNDLAMLAWAGIGVAMGNAHPDVCAVADDIARTNADDGVAQVIEGLLQRL